MIEFFLLKSDRTVHENFGLVRHYKFFIHKWILRVQRKVGRSRKKAGHEKCSNSGVIKFETSLHIASGLYFSLPMTSFSLQSS